MRLLISGASGLIGSAFLKAYGSRFSQIYAIGRQKTEGCDFIQYDFAVPSPTLVLPEVDVFLHFAGQTSVYAAEADPITDLNINVCGFLNILNILKKQSPRPFVVLAGTATQTGLTTTADRVSESKPDAPITNYDLSKLTAERYLLHDVEAGLLNGCSLRLTNVYGATSIGTQAVERGVIDKMFKRALNGQVLTLYGDGMIWRDYIHIDDVVEAFWMANQNQDAVNGQFFVIGSGRGVRLSDAFQTLVQLAHETTGQAVAIENTDPPQTLSPIEFRSFVADPSAFQGLTGWSASHDLESGLRQSYQDLFS